MNYSLVLEITKPSELKYEKYFIKEELLYTIKDEKYTDRNKSSFNYDVYAF